jgi:DNA (cytosine-5)-methyltransferase 1
VSRPRLLDLFAGGQGAGVGYARAGFEVHSVDIERHAKHSEIASFTVADAMEILAGRGVLDLRAFDVVHASPPCQSETTLRHVHGRPHPNLLGPTLDALRGMRGVMWIVENVPSTKQMDDALMLCGASFGLSAGCRDGIRRPLKRHRLFASSHWLMGPGCACSGREALGVYGNGGGGPQTRGYRGVRREMAEAMGIDWMGVGDLSQAIPPAYTEFIGGQLLEHLRAAA